MRLVHEQNHLQRLNPIYHRKIIVQLPHNDVQNERNDESLGFGVVPEALEVDHL
ncbi:MAG: hypothetical protein HZT41_10095 [Dechloromonas sp.]|nr:MAG: hypothetical protein HZT41_10095 [Dechloromonas sp.]